jgi:hypothetical protein
MMHFIYKWLKKWCGACMQTQMAGYVTTYNKPVGTPGSFLFTTVRGAGHMVPRYRPAVTSQFHSAIPDDFLEMVDLARQAWDGEGRACSPGALLRVCV